MNYKHTNITNDLKNTNSRLFISQYNALFNKFLNSLSSSSRHVIRNNKELNDLYDLFLDFIIDSSQHLDYIDANKQAKEVCCGEEDPCS